MKKIFVALACATFFANCNPNQVLHRADVKSNLMTGKEEKMEKTTNFLDFKFNLLDGSAASMADFKGKKIVVLNVASECGYTPQYADWEKFYKDHQENTVVVGFPCNQFGGQESGTASEIKTFCEKNYGVTFPVAEKVDVKGSQQSPIFDWLSDKSKNGWCEKEPSWNFCKYLLNENGELIGFYASNVKPTDGEFLKDFEAKN